MAKLLSGIVRGQIVLLHPLLRRMDVKASRVLQDALGALGERILTDNVTYIDEAFPECNASWAEPKGYTPGKAILYLHGGAYTAGSLVYARCFGGVLAENTCRRTLCLGYRLAPEAPYPAALDDALAAYTRLLQEYAPEDICLVGESAGGGLCYCLCLRLKERGLPLPARVVALSPWTDLLMAGDYDEHAVNDPILSADNLRDSARMYAGEQADIPTISPLFGDLRGLPPSLILAGTDEILLRDSVDMAEKLRAAGCECEIYVEPDMWHVYVLYGIPEAREALIRIREFVLRDDGDEEDGGVGSGDAYMDEAGQRGEHIPADADARLGGDVPAVRDS